MTHFYPYVATQRLYQRGSRDWLELVEGLAQVAPTSPEMLAFAQTMRALRDTLGLEKWLLTDPSNAMDLNFILDCYKGDEAALLERYATQLAALRDEAA